MTDEEHTFERSGWPLAMRIGGLALLLAVAVTAVALYSRYDAHASVAYSEAGDDDAYVEIIARYPFTMAARAARGQLWTQLDHDGFAALVTTLKSHPPLHVSPLLRIDYLGILLASLAFVLCLWCRSLTRGNKERIALLVLNVFALLQVLLLGVLPFVPRWLPGWLDTSLHRGSEYLFHLLAALVVILLVLPLAVQLRRRFEVMGRFRCPTIVWQPLLELYGRTRESSWEPRVLVWATRLLTHVAVFAAVLWIPMRVWDRALPPLLAHETPVSSRFVMPGLSTTLWGELHFAIEVLIVIYAIQLIRRVWKAARSQQAIEAIVHRGLFLLPVLAMVHRLLSDLAQTAQLGSPTMYPIALYVFAAVGMAIGIHLYYVILVRIVDAAGTFQRLRVVPRRSRAWFGIRDNRWRFSFHAVAVVLLVGLMFGTNTRAPFHRLIRASHPTRVVLEGPFAYICLETEVMEMGERTEAEGVAAGDWRTATPNRVVDHEILSDASAVEIGVFWLAFAVGYVCELLLACVIVTLYFALGVALIGPVLIIMAAIVAFGQTMAAVIDALLLILFLFTGWNPGFASNLLWDSVLGPLFDRVDMAGRLIPLKGVLASVRGAGFDVGMRLVMSLPSFILVALVLVFAHRWNMKRIGVERASSGRPRWLPAGYRGEDRDTTAADSAVEEGMEAARTVEELEGKTDPPEVQYEP